MNNDLTPEQKRLGKVLTKLQRRVVNGVVAGKSQRQAYVDAGGTAKTKEAQDACVCVMLSTVKVKAYLDSLMDTADKRAIMTREEALERLTKSAKASIIDVCEFENVKIGEDAKGNPIYKTNLIVKDAQTIPPEIAVCIKSISMTNHGLRIELHDSHGAIQQLAKMQGWEADKKFKVNTTVKLEKVERVIVD